MSVTTAPARSFTRKNYARQVIGNLIAAPVFVIVVSLVPEPYRQVAMAALLTAAGTAYLRHGLGRLEWAIAAVIVACGLLGFVGYAAIGVGWLLHAVADVVHHLIDRPMFARMPMSSFGCAVFDPLIAIWFLLGAPTIAIPF